MIGAIAQYALAAPNDTLNKDQADRLMAFGKLWGFIKYSHPSLAYREGEWDRAFVDSVPAVLSARSADEYRTAVAALLRGLNDPVTRVIAGDTAPSASSTASFAIEEQADATIIHFGATSDDSADFGFGTAGDVGRITAKLNAASAKLAQAKALIFDLEGVSAVRDMNDDHLDALFSRQSGLSTLLVTREMWAPGSRMRFQIGYPPELSGEPAGGYSSGFTSLSGVRFLPRPGAKAPPCVFIVTKSIPSLALALQDEGRAAIITIGDAYLEDVAAPTRKELSDNVIVQTRLSELIHADGRVGFAPDYAVKDMASARAAAQRWLSAPDERKRLATDKPSRAAPNVNSGDTFALRQRGRGELPSMPERALAVFKAWAIIEYFSMYKELMDSNWTDVVRAALPGVISASSAEDYGLAIARMLVQLDDGHVNVNTDGFWQLMGGPTLRPTDRLGRPPFLVRMIEGSPVITEVLPDASPAGECAAPGDEIVAIDGRPWRERYDEISACISASTPGWREDKVLGYLLWGLDQATMSVRLRDPAGKERDVKIVLKDSYRNRLGRGTGEVSRLLRSNIGYADLSRLEVTEVDTMFDRFRDTRAIIFDMRGYPRGTAWSIASRLVGRAEVPAAIMESPVFAPGLQAFRAMVPQLKRTINVPAPSKTRYTGRTVMLIDERAQSQAEHSGLLLRAANGTKFVGSPTSGAVGNISTFYLPGGILVSFGAQSERWPNGDQLQRVGLNPDVRVRPTKAGIVAGRDEVLEAALAYLDSELK